MEAPAKVAITEFVGPVIKGPASTPNTEHLKAAASAMADWICRLQTPGGYIPQHVDPYTSSVSLRADWPRMAFTALALGTYGQELNEPAYLKAADATADFVNSSLNDLILTTKEDALLIRAYLGRLALLRGREDVAAAHAHEIRGLLPEIKFRPIVFLQSASLFLELARRQVAERIDTAEKMARKAMHEWEQHMCCDEAVSFAGFAELVPILFTLSIQERLQAKEFSQHYATIREWYLSHQYPDGAFPNDTHSAFAYTRGTGKIFEALAIDKTNSASCFRSFAWICGLQYSEESLFCVAPEFRGKIRGAVMHDTLNRTAWVDSAGHALIGAARLLSHVHSGEIPGFSRTDNA